MDDILREKLRKIEALFAGAATHGEQQAAGAAAERIRAKLKETAQREDEIEIKFTVSDPWTRQLFVALCRRYGLKPFRYPRMHKQSIVVRAPQTFLETVLWPEFQQLADALTIYLSDITNKIIQEEVHANTQDAEEERPQQQLALG